MLVLSRHRDESVYVGNDITVTVVDIRGDRVRLGFAAPIEVTILRTEILDARWRDGSPLPEPPHETAIRSLSELSLPDSESCHKDADQILLAFLRASGNAAVADAWEEAKSRVGFWYS